MCLSKADTALLYIKTTQNSPTPHNAAAKKDNSGGNNNSGGGGKGGGGGRDFKNKKNKTNGKQINQTAGSKKQQGNSSGNSSGNSDQRNESIHPQDLLLKRPKQQQQ